MNVTSVHWWTGVERYNRPLLVLTTESSPRSPATLQIWNTGRGTGTRILRCDVNELEKEDSYDSSGNINADLKPIQFSRGLGQASSGSSGQILFCGTSSGSVLGIEYKQGKGGGFNRMCTLREFSHPVVALAGDRKESDFLAGSDEAGNLVIWTVAEELDRDGTNIEDYRATVVYRYFQQDDFFCSIGIRDNIVIAGHASGYLTIHDMDRKMLLASVATNTKAVTCLDFYQHKNLALVCGEDGRVSVLGFSQNRGYRPVVHFSAALDAIVTGCAFSNSQRGFPRIAILTWEKCSVLQFEYEKAKNKVKEQISVDVEATVTEVRRPETGISSPILSPFGKGQYPISPLKTTASAESLLLTESEPFQTPKSANTPDETDGLLIDEVRIRAQ